MYKILATDEIELYGANFIQHSKRTKHEQHVTNCIIKRYGQFQPLLVEGIMDGWHLIAGHDTLRALKDLGIPFAWCFEFRDLDFQDSLSISMIQNQNRELDVIKNAKTLEKMLECGEVNYKSLANVLHHTRDEIHNFKQLKEFNWEDFDNDPTHFQTSLF